MKFSSKLFTMLFRYLLIFLIFVGSSLARELGVVGILLTTNNDKYQDLTLSRVSKYTFLVVSNKTRKVVDRIVVSVGLDGLGVIFDGDKREISLKLEGVKFVDMLAIIEKNIETKGISVFLGNEAILFSFLVSLPLTKERFFFDSDRPVSVSELLKLTSLKPEKVEASIRQIDLDGDFKLREVEEFDSVFLKPGKFKVTFSEKKPTP